MLIHAASSSVGLALIQIARRLGASTIVATAGSAHKLEQAREVGATAGFNRSEDDWASEVLRLRPEGVDVVFDPVGGSYAADNCKSLRTDGTWVLYGLMGGGAVDGVPILSLLLRKRITLIPATLRSRTIECVRGHPASCALPAAVRP